MQEVVFSRVLTPNVYKAYARWRIREKKYKDEHKLPCSWKPHNQ